MKHFNRIATRLLKKLAYNDILNISINKDIKIIILKTS